MIKTPLITDVAEKARKSTIILALAVCSLLASRQSVAQTATATLLQTGTGATTFDTTQGASFSLDLRITTDFISSGITYFLQVSPNGSGFFRITGRNTVGSPYPSRSFSDAEVTSPMGGLLDPVNDFDLGAINEGSETDPAGNYFISTLTILVNPGTPNGSYSIFLDNRSIVTDRTGGGFQDRPITALATVNVVPEPSTVGLAVVGGARLLLLLRRKQRARV